MHKVCLSTGSSTCSEGIGNDIDNLLISKKVDLVLQGHDHSYQRSKQLALNGSTCTSVVAETYNSSCVVNDGASGSYSKGAGTVINIVGTGGFEMTQYGNIYTSDGDYRYFATSMGGNRNPCFGWVKMMVSAGQLVVRFMGATNTSTYTDQYTITAAGTTPLATPTPQATATASKTPQPGTCPSNWSCADIGTPALAGSQSLSGGTWTVRGAGGDIWGTADQFHYVWQTLSGDGSISARVASQTNTDPWAKAGVMLRQSTGAGDLFYDAMVTPGNGITVQYRATAGANAVEAARLTGAVPVYLKVTRTGNTFTAYTSSNGTTWTAVAGSSVTIAMSGAVLRGMAVTSHNVGALGTVTFDTVSISTSVAPNPTPTSAPLPPMATASPTPMPGGTPLALATIAGNGLSAPKGITVVNAQVWVANSGSNTLSRFNPDGSAAGSPLAGNGLNNPYGMAVVGSQVWVANAGSNTLSRFNPDGTSAGSPLAGNGLNVPKGITVVGTQVWVSNHGNGTLSRFNPDGSAAGSPLAGSGLDGPRGGVVVNAQVWIPNVNTSTLSLFNPDGSAAGSPLTGNGLNAPEGATAVGTQVWVVNNNTNVVSRFNQDGTSAGSALAGNGLNQPHGIAVVSAHQVWVINAGGNTISRWQV